MLRKAHTTLWPAAWQTFCDLPHGRRLQPVLDHDVIVYLSPISSIMDDAKISSGIILAEVVGLRSGGGSPGNCLQARYSRYRQRKNIRPSSFFFAKDLRSVFSVFEPSL